MGLLSRAVGGARRGLARAGEYVAENPAETALAVGGANMGLIGGGGMMAIMGGMAKEFEDAKRSIEMMPPGPRRDRAIQVLRTQGPQAALSSLHRGDSAGGY